MECKEQDTKTTHCVDCKYLEITCRYGTSWLFGVCHYPKDTGHAIVTPLDTCSYAEKCEHK